MICGGIGVVCLILHLILLSSSLHSASLTDLVREGAEKLETRLPSLRLTAEDLAIPSRWPVEHAIPAVERLLENPDEAPLRLSEWIEEIEKAEAPSQVFSVARNILGESAKDFPPSKNHGPVERILEAMEKAHPFLKYSYSRLSPQERQEILSVHDYPAALDPGESPRNPTFRKKAFKNLFKFKNEKLLEAAERVLSAVDHEAANLNDLKPTRFKTKLGDVIVSGKGDDVYGKETLENACLLIDLGGNNRYDGPPAGAGEGQIKVVIDFGENVTVASDESSPSAGAGVFGIGLFYLPNPSGSKIVKTASYSQGFGLCGVGGFFANGKGIFKADRYAQGAGGFGAGIFTNSAGKGSEYSADLYAQGVGFTRGVGIFRHRGSSSTFKAGLVEPDPREALGSTSLCQGVGYGPRAYAAGGVGLCVLTGNRLAIESSYFAQGAGYWHAAGAFKLEGSSCTIQSRRYSQGSGVHSALGAFFLEGDGNRMDNWGVGPAFGWDRSIGWAFLFGNRNSARTEWGSASAAMNGSRSFLFSKGSENIFELSGIGGGGTAREIADYAVSWIEGSGNRLKSPYFKQELVENRDIHTSPWGLVHLEGVILSSETALPKPQWNRLEDGKSHKNRVVNFVREIERAQSLPAENKVETLLAAASAFSTDKINPRAALAQLIALPDEEIPLLVRFLDPADFDGFIQIRSALSEIGPAAAPAILREIKSAKGERRAWLLAQLPYLGADDALPELFRCLKNADLKIQAAGFSGIGRMLSRDRGYEPGRMTILENLKVYLSSQNPAPELEQELSRGLSTRSYFESAAIFSMVYRPDAAERFLFQFAPPELSGTYEEAEVKKVLKILRERKDKILENLNREIERSRACENAAGEIFAAALKSEPAKNKVLAAVIINAMGNLGRPEDAGRVAPFLHDSSATVKETASSALGRIGEASFPYLEKVLKTGAPAEKAQAVCSVSRAWNPSLFRILEIGLADSDPLVRNTSVGMVSALRFPFDEKREKIKETLKREGGLEIRYLYGK